MLPKLSRVEVHKVGPGLKVVNCLLRQHLRGPDGHEATLQAEHTPSAEEDGTDALDCDLKRWVDKWLLYRLQVVTICTQHTQRGARRRRAPSMAEGQKRWLSLA